MKYSIITPVYNREDCISRCIESVLQQVNKCEKTGVNIEHIIVNDGSTDLTDEICKGYAKYNSYIKYISFIKTRAQMLQEMPQLKRQLERIALS